MSQLAVSHPASSNGKGISNTGSSFMALPLMCVSVYVHVSYGSGDGGGVGVGRGGAELPRNRLN